MNNPCNDIEREKFLAAMALVSNKDTWTQGTMARDRNENRCADSDEYACKFCSLGALFKAGNNGRTKHFTIDFCYKYYNHNLTVLNDSREHSTVVAIWQHYLDYCDGNNLWKIN